MKKGKRGGGLEAAHSTLCTNGYLVLGYAQGELNICVQMTSNEILDILFLIEHRSGKRIKDRKCIIVS